MNPSTNPIMNRYSFFAVLIVPLAVAFSPVAGAQDAAAAGGPGSGSARDWVELQKSNSAASPIARPLPGEIADRSFQRYADSFSQQIPATLDREEFLSGGGGSVK
ncbi:MAG: DUF3613 domain-containing protein [Panacagrimonas sp.]